MKRVIFLVLVAAVIGGLVVWMGRPSVGTVYTRKTTDQNTIVKEWQRYQGRSLSFDYPPELQIMETEEQKAVLVGKAGVSEELVVWIRPFTDRLEELADIKMRQVKKEMYEPMVMGNDTCYRNKNAAEWVCWRQKAGEVLSVALTANSNDQELPTNFERIIKSLDWN